MIESIPSCGLRLTDTFPLQHLSKCYQMCCSCYPAGCVSEILLSDSSCQPKTTGKTKCDPPHYRNFHPKGDGGSGRRPLSPDHLTF